MTNLSSKCRLPGGKNNLKCSNFCPHLIYDDPYIFRVRSQRSQSHSFPCDVCIRRAKQQQQRPSTTKIQYQQRCSRLPPRPIDLEHINRPKTVPSQRITNNCNWDNFLNNQSKYAIGTPYALCDLTDNQRDSENRPPFVNYGGQYNDKQSGQKRTFNSRAVHQLKHDEVDEQRLRSLFRERHLRQQAEDYFQKMKKEKFYDQNEHFRSKCRNCYRSSQD